MDNAARRPPAKPEPRKPEFDEHAQRDDQHQGGLPPDLLAKVSNRLDKLTHQLDLRERRTAETEIAAVNSRLETLTRKLDQHQNQGPDEGLAAVKERLDTLAQQFDRRRSPAEGHHSAVREPQDAERHCRNEAPA